MRTYDWTKFYEAAVLETDITKRPERVAKAQELIRQHVAVPFGRPFYFELFSIMSRFPTSFEEIELTCRRKR